MRPLLFDRGLCLLCRDFVDFFLTTQPEECERLAQHLVQAFGSARSALPPTSSGAACSTCSATASRTLGASFASPIFAPRLGSITKPSGCTR